MYKLQPTTWRGEAKTIQRLSDSAFIPMDESNTDYQEYLKFLAEGNTPLPADNE
jgi:hypothetical protein